MYKGHAPKRKGRRQRDKFGDRRGGGGPVAWARSQNLAAVAMPWALWQGWGSGDGTVGWGLWALCGSPACLAPWRDAPGSPV